MLAAKCKLKYVEGMDWIALRNLTASTDIWAFTKRLCTEWLSDVTANLVSRLRFTRQRGLKHKTPPHNTVYNHFSDFKDSGVVFQPFPVFLSLGLNPLLPSDTCGSACSFSFVPEYSSQFLTFPDQTGSKGNAPDLYLGGAPF